MWLKNPVVPDVQVRFLESRQDMQGNFTVNIDRSEVDSLHGQYAGQLADWKARCEASEAKLAAANIQVGWNDFKHPSIPGGQPAGPP